jgi:hypothetical protein
MNFIFMHRVSAVLLRRDSANGSIKVIDARSKPGTQIPLISKPILQLEHLKYPVISVHL